MSDRRAERAHWDRLATRLTDFHDAVSTQYYREREIQLIRRAFGSVRGKRVLKLDLWNEAFNTRILFWLEAEGAVTCGLDVSGCIARTARERARALGWAPGIVQGDIRSLPFAGESCDFVYSMGTIEHIAETAEAVSEISRVLRPGGRAVLGVPRKWDPFLRPVIVRGLTALGKYPYAPERSFGTGELCRIVEGAGLRIVERTGLLCMPGLLRMLDLYLFLRRSPLARVTPPLLVPFREAERRWAWARRLGYLLTVVAEK